VWHFAPVVGLGASAGGLESLEQFFGSIPVASGTAFVVVEGLANVAAYAEELRSDPEELSARYRSFARQLRRCRAFPSRQVAASQRKPAGYAGRRSETIVSGALGRVLREQGPVSSPHVCIAGEEGIPHYTVQVERVHQPRFESDNEELVASNEELQSTNEELHSVNEELYTVNAEYQTKIEELQQLNADIEHLLEGTEVGTVFLDSDLRIRRFTARVARVFRLQERDLGREIRDFEPERLFRLLASPDSGAQKKRGSASWLDGEQRDQ
jgi:hypothetical protein